MFFAARQVFPYRHNTEVNHRLLIKTLTSGSERRSDEYVQKKDGGKGHFESMCGFCLKYVPPYVEYNFGGVLILCTSVVRMKLLAEKLAPAVEAAGRHVLVQGSMPRAKLVKVFLNNPSSVLIATNSFREGLTR